MGKTGIVLLAAGNSSRMGRAKQLLDFGGKPLIRYTAEAALQAGCGPVMVVCGAAPAETQAAIAGSGAGAVVNEQWESGMGSSIQAGLRALEEFDLDGAILSLGDLPLVTAEIYRQLLATRERTGKPIVASAYAGTVGVPVYFSREFFPALLALPPSMGCKGIILGNPDDAAQLPCPEAEVDVDTPADYAKALQRLAAGG